MSQPSSCLQELLLSILGYESLPTGHASRSPTELLSSCISQEAVALVLSKTSSSLSARLQALTESFQSSESGPLCQAQVSLLAVACFRIFRTANACSFSTEQPEDPFHKLVNQTHDTTLSSTWALQQLSADGEDVVGPIQAPQYLVVALTLLCKPFGLDVLRAEAATAPQCTATTLGGPAATLGSSHEEEEIQSSIMAVEAANPGMAAWAARAVMCQQRLLARPCLSLQRALVHLTAAAVAPVPESALRSAAAAVSHTAQEPRTQQAIRAALRSAMQIESSLVWLEYRHVSTASEHAAQALRDLCMHLSTEGALGKRTEAQQTAKAQLVLRVDWQVDGDGEIAQKQHKGILEGCSWPGFPAHEVWPQAEQQKGSAWEGWVDDSGVRHVPQLHNGAEKVLVLAPLEQAAVLANTTLQRRGKARSESIADWIVAPGVEALLMQQRTVFAVAACTLLLRIRHELERPRVRERGLLALQALYDFLKEMPLESHQIEPLLYTTPMPLHCDVRAEMAAVWVKAGMMGQAMSEYESLGRWERLVDCYMFCGKAAAAESVLSERLKVDGENPQLLCAMGKLLRQDEWFERAWQASKCTHAGSQRELARSALSRSAYEAAANHFTLALSRNPLDAESWFGLGFCELKRGEERGGHAAVAFTRCVQADGSHGEAWNNLGALHVAAGRYGPAFKALSVSIKLCQRTWQISDNYAVAAMHCKEFTTAAKASVEATKLSNGTHVNTRVLEALVAEVELRRGYKHHLHEIDSSASQQVHTDPQQAPHSGLNVGSERHAELDSCHATEAEGEVEDMGEEAARLLEALSTLHITSVDAPVDTSAESVDDSAKEMDDPDVEARQRAFLEKDVRKALEAACSVSNVPAQALWQLCRFHRCTGDVSAAKEAGFKWLRALQAHGWQEDETSVADVATCCESLYTLHTDEVSKCGLDASDLKKWWSPLRLQVSAAARAVARSLGEYNSTALQLKQLAEQILSQTQ